MIARLRFWLRLLRRCPALFNAIRTVCELHTREDHRTGGYIVMGGAGTAPYHFLPMDYTQAWGVLRRSVGLPSLPEDYL